MRRKTCAQLHNTKNQLLDWTASKAIVLVTHLPGRKMCDENYGSSQRCSKLYKANTVVVPQTNPSFLSSVCAPAPAAGDIWWYPDRSMVGFLTESDCFLGFQKVPMAMVAMSGWLSTSNRPRNRVAQLPLSMWQWIEAKPRRYELDRTDPPEYHHDHEFGVKLEWCI